MNVVVTGGAGFIGSHLVDVLVARGDHVVVLDDLSTGYAANIHPAARFIHGSVADANAVHDAVADAHLVFHQAALGAVPRSVDRPLESDTANTHGTLTVLKAAADAGVGRVVYASSSSIYGGAADLPTPETAPALPRSPYAVTKLAGEHYCRVFAELFGLETVALRYFNVFGPRQRPESAYAAVIPRFIDAVLDRRPPTVHGDGHQSRDFTFVADAVAANIAAGSAPAQACSGRLYNVAAGGQHSLLDLLRALERVCGAATHPLFEPPRRGDIRHSQADISAARRDLGYQPATLFEDGLRETVDWLVETRQPTLRHPVEALASSSPERAVREGAGAG